MGQLQIIVFRTTLGTYRKCPKSSMERQVDVNVGTDFCQPLLMSINTVLQMVEGRRRAVNTLFSRRRKWTILTIPLTKWIPLVSGQRDLTQVNLTSQLPYEKYACIELQRIGSLLSRMDRRSQWSHPHRNIVDCKNILSQ